MNKEVEDYLKKKEFVIDGIAKFPCEFCTKLFETERGKNIHQSKCKENPKNNEDIDKYNQCEFCKEYFHIRNLTRHKETCRKNPDHKVKKRKHPLPIKPGDILDYEKINGKYKKCEFCNQIFEKDGYYKHRAYCSENKNGKSKYSNEKKWKCTFCNSLFTSETALKTHRPRCEKNPNIKEFYLDNFERLRDLKIDYPEIYNILTPEQIKEFLDGEK